MNLKFCSRFCNDLFENDVKCIKCWILFQKSFLKFDFISQNFVENKFGQINFGEIFSKKFGQTEFDEIKFY